MTNNSGFSIWLDRFFDTYYLRRPVNATFIGRHEYDHLTPDFSVKAVDEMRDEMKSLLVSLHDLPVEGLSQAERIDRQLAEGYLRTQLWEFDSNHFWSGNPCLYTGEAVFGVISLFLTDYAPIGERVSAAIDRMNAIPNLFGQAKANISEAPKAWVEQALVECTGAIKFFGNGIRQLVQDYHIQNNLFEAAVATALKAYVDYQAYLQTDLMMHTNEKYACGVEAFHLMMKYGHCIDINLDEFASYAEGQIAEAEAYLLNHAVDFGCKTSGEALARLGDIHPTAEKYYSRFGELWQECKTLAGQKDLVTWPDFPIEYIPQPVWAREAAPYLYFLPYRSPAAFNRPAVHRYLVPPLDPNLPADKQEKFLRAVNEDVIKTNHVIHHGSIGHHIQNWNAFHCESRIGRMAAVDCASRLAMFCAGTMAEGWAVYVGSMMEDAGFLTPLEAYAEVQSHRRMSARAVVDIRLHRGEFSLQQAVEFYQQHGGMNADFALREAVKNSMFPGAAMMYLFGSDRINSFRDEAAHAMGSKFNMKKFHDRFLSFGSIPVELVCTEMKRMMTDAQ